MISADNLGLPIPEIAQAYTRSWETNRRTSRRGGRYKRLEVTDFQRVSIKFWRREGRSWRWIGHRLGVSESTAYRWGAVCASN